MRRLRPLSLLSLLVACSSSGGDIDATDDSVNSHTPSPAVKAAANACADAIDAIPTTAWHPEGHVDSAADGAIERAAKSCLTSYIQLRTVNPRTPDDVGEIAAADFFAQIYERLGIPTRMTPLAKGNVPDDVQRMSVVATLRGKNPSGSVILLNHTDVVPATGDWTHPPFSGHDDGTFIWGRGALDMKSIGVTQMLAIALLKRAGVVLEHDVHFAGVADEEVGGRGSEFLALGRLNGDGSAQQLDPLGLQPAVVLNEGGTGIKDALLPGRDVFVVGVEEKGVVWTQFAHRDPKALLHAIARIGIVTAPKSAGLPSSSDRKALGGKCTLAGIITDETQKTNVQPRVAKVTLDCEPGSQTGVEQAVANLAKSFDLAPKITITNASGPRDHLDIAIEYGAGGHGSNAVGATALDVAIAVLTATGQIDGDALKADSGVTDRLFKLGLSPANQTFVNTLARSEGEAAESVASFITSKPGLSGDLLGLADSHLPTTAPFHNTCSFTALKFPADGEARGKLDCRLTFDTKANDLEQSLLRIVAQDGAALRTDQSLCFDCYKQEFNQSPSDNLEYKIVERGVQKSSPAAVTAPYMFPGSSDTFFFRRAGVPTYGFMPASVGEEELHTFHAVNERLPISSLVPSVHVYTEVVQQLADREAPAPTDASHRLDGRGVTCRARKRSGGGFQWGSAVTPLACEGSLYLCTRDSAAPRFVSAVPDENDAEVSSVARLPAGYDPNGTDATEEPPVEARLFVPRKDNARVFAGDPFEVDTGAGASRSFLVRCETPLHQRLATFFTRSKLHFYSE